MESLVQPVVLKQSRGVSSRWLAVTVEHGIWTRVSHSVAEIRKRQTREWAAVVVGASELRASECRGWRIHDVMARFLPSELLDSTGRRGFVRKPSQKYFRHGCIKSRTDWQSVRNIPMRNRKSQRWPDFTFRDVSPQCCNRCLAQRWTDCKSVLRGNFMQRWGKLCGSMSVGQD